MIYIENEVLPYLQEDADYGAMEAFANAAEELLAMAANEAGAAMGFMGMNMAANMTGSMAGFMQGANNNQNTMADPHIGGQAQGDRICACGTADMGRFCQNCGKPQP